jgi:hypothetical protein
MEPAFLEKVAYFTCQGHYEVCSPRMPFRHLLFRPPSRRNQDWSNKIFFTLFKYIKNTNHGREVELMIPIQSIPQNRFWGELKKWKKTMKMNTTMNGKNKKFDTNPNPNATHTYIHHPH